MNNEQLEIERRFGKNQPFKVPEGYFDRLAADVMANIPEQKPVATVPLSWWRRLRPVAVAAACVCAAVFSIQLFLHAPSDKHHAVPHVSSASQTHGDSYGTLDMAADYTMIDNDYIYAMVSENQ